MRIVSYNTRGSLGMDDRRSTPRIAQVVRSLSPDLVCFQEIHQRLPWSGGEDQPLLLGQLLGRAFVFQRLLHIGFGGFGNGIALRGRIGERKEHLLSSKKEQRGALELRLHDIGGLHRLTVFCTHWGLQEEERRQQAAELAALINAAPRPLILCGDLNEGADGAALRHLLTETGLRDADAERNQATYPSNAPSARIDYILYSPELTLRHYEVVASEASDHRPILADFDRAS